VTENRASETETGSAAPAPAVLIPQPHGAGFAALVGQDAAVGALQTALRGKRLPHALLFAGPPGIGKASCALILAQAVNCTRSGPLDSCGECGACSRLRRGLHPDLLWIAPQRGTIKIGAITPRDGGPEPQQTVTGFVGYAPYEARRRVVVLDGSEAMNPEAQNALLKTLEEPPRSSLLILITAAPAALLPTVRSRCQSLRFSPLPQRKVRHYLENDRGYPPQEAEMRAALAPGSIGGALAVDLDAYESLLGSVVEALRLAVNGGGGVVTAAQSLSTLGEGDTAAHKAASVLRVARDILRDLLVLSSGAGDAGMVNRRQAAAWSPWADEFDGDALAAAATAATRALDRMTAPIRPNIKMAFEKALFEIADALDARADSGRPLRSW